MPPIIFKPVELTYEKFTNKFSKRENWKKEHKYISTTRLIIGFILGLIGGVSIYYLIDKWFI